MSAVMTREILSGPTTSYMHSPSCPFPRVARRLLSAAFILLFLAGPAPAFAAAPAPAPAPLSFEEVYPLLKKHLIGTTEGELSDAAARGLISQLTGRVSLIGEGLDARDPARTNRLVVATLAEREYAYLKVSRLMPGAADEFNAACRGLMATNAIKGLILDLRFAAGQDFAEALKIADRFFARELQLVDWGEGWRSSTAKTNAITLPIAMLVNRSTTGAAEALAGMLRHREIGLLIGGATAGQASMAREFQLATGQRLRLAIAPLKVADGRELSTAGLKPDVDVDVPLDADLAWYEDPFRVSPRLARLGTNETGTASASRTPRRRINEAELVRMSRDGQDPERDALPATSPGRSPEPAPRVLSDPVLLRALDLLKGLSVVQQFRSS